jgi:hypothetical protein
MRSKKGSWVGFALHPAFEVLVAMSVMLALLYFIHSLDEKTSFEKRFLATDLALLIDSIPAMPQQGSLYLIYNPQRSNKFGTNYSYNFSDGYVAVMTKENDRQPGIYFFTQDPSMPVEKKVFMKTNAMIVPGFIKQGNQVLIEDRNKRTITYSPEMLSCNGQASSVKIIASPSHENNPDYAMEKDMAAVVNGQSAYASGIETPLIIRAGNTTPDQIFVKAYVNGENDPVLLSQSQRIGCEIANSVMLYWKNKGVDVLGAAVIPINPDQNAADDDNALAKGKIGVLVELGTIQQKGLFDASNVVELGLAIATGVQNAK